MRSSHSFWPKNRLASELIGIKALFDDYWGSDKHEFTVASMSSSPTSPLISDHEAQRTLSSLESITSIVGLWNYNSLQPLPFVSLQLPIQPAHNLRIEGLATLFALYTRTIVKGILPLDERIDRGGCGEHYSIWRCIRRGPFIHVEASRTLIR